MNICIQDLSFKYGDKPLFNNINVEVECLDRPIIILGPSGSGKTTLLKLLAGLLKPEKGEICFCDEAPPPGEKPEVKALKTAFMFQESRLLPWLTVLENVSLPLKNDFGREEGVERAKHFLSMVSLSEKLNSYPMELSGGEAQRVSMARAFAWPAPVLLMDEPFQSLDIPLRINLIDLTLSLLEKEKRFLITVTHDPRMAVYMGARIIILGKPGEGIVLDKKVLLSDGDRSFSSAAGRELERELIGRLGP